MPLHVNSQHELPKIAPLVYANGDGGSAVQGAIGICVLGRDVGGAIVGGSDGSTTVADTAHTRSEVHSGSSIWQGGCCYFREVEVPGWWL